MPRGPKGAKYPWGSEDADPSRANYSESEIGHPSPVGAYPSGVSAEGVCDLIGNVLEWTSSKCSASYVWRGGSFHGSRLNARSPYRDCERPGFQAHYLGFRLAGVL